MSKLGLLACIIGISALAQSPKTPTFDRRLGVATIVREDIFAGFMANDNEKFLRGEKNVEILLTERPEQKAQLLALKAFIALKRAVDANEAKRQDEFDREYNKAIALYAEAAKVGPEDVGRLAVTGGSYAIFADRLPERYRRDAWSTAYTAYSGLWKVQAPIVEKLPLHMKGELIAGMAQSAQRSGHAAESAEFVQRILTTLPGTPYANMAKKWTDSPETAARSSLTCHTCHDEGRLEARKAALAKAQ